MPSRETSFTSGDWCELADASNDLFLGLNADGSFCFLNRLGRDLLGWSGDEVRRKWLRDVVDPSAQAGADEAIARLHEKGEPVDFQMTLRAGARRLALTGRLWLRRAEGAPTLILGVFHEQGVRPAAEWRESLAEQQIIQNVAREKELVELKSHFISMASHELRTPLAALALGLDFLAKYRQKLPDEQIDKNLKIANATVRQLRSVLDDVLIISRDDEGRLSCNRSRVELAGFCRKVAEDAAASDQHRHSILVQSRQDPCETSVDPQLLNHILVNLLSNACKYSEPEQPVEVAIAQTNEHIVLTVTDHGIGIPVADQPQLFQLFFRGGNVGTVTGTGLGLVVVRRCVEAHRGTITFASKPGEGTRFIVTLPTGDHE